MRIAVILLALVLTGCASLRETAESTDTFAACKALDVATTAYGVKTGLLVEKNPLVSGLIGQGVLPFAIISFAVWMLIDHINNKHLTMGLNVATCPIAAHNLLLIAR